MTARGLVRVGDRVEGVCRAHKHPRAFTGVWVSGSDAVTSDGLAVIRVGDIGVTDCGHEFRATQGSDTCTADGIGLHRVGDPVVVTPGGDGVTVTGSEVSTAE